MIDDHGNLVAGEGDARFSFETSIQRDLTHAKRLRETGSHWRASDRADLAPNHRHRRKDDPL